MIDFRTEQDSMGEIQVPAKALYGAHTQRAIDNFTISDLRLPGHFIAALALIKAACARINGELGLLDNDLARAIEKVAREVARGRHKRQFPVAALLREWTGFDITEASDQFEAQATVDATVELSGQLKTVAVSLIKIANDLRWMNSGPGAGLGEITLTALQPGSSIMPGKVNPVIPEAVAMVAAEVIGNYTTITIAGQSGNFQLNVMLPIVAYNLLQSIDLLANASHVLADKAVSEFSVNQAVLNEPLARNPILARVLNPLIGYENAAAIAKRAWAEGRTVREVAGEMTDLDEATLDRLLDPARLARGLY